MKMSNEKNNPITAFKKKDLKPFNIERALAGDEVVVEWRELGLEYSYYPLKSIMKKGNQIAFTFGSNGQGSCSLADTSHLFMTPKTRTVWLNVFRATTGGWGNQLFSTVHLSESLANDPHDVLPCYSLNLKDRVSGPIEIEIADE
jgi:hypothetical protein